jgi:hypothetical protein
MREILQQLIDSTSSGALTQRIQSKKYRNHCCCWFVESKNLGFELSVGGDQVESIGFQDETADDQNVSVVYCWLSAAVWCSG